MERPVRIGLALAVGVPVVVYLLSSSAYDYWLDCGEFVGAAATLGITHPPGHPLEALVARAVALLPFGSFSLRVAFASAIATAGALGFLFLAAVRVARAVGVADSRVSAALALAASWSIGATHAWWTQAVRPEVYGLQALVLSAAFERLTCFATTGSSDRRPLYATGLAVGFGLANHHFLAFLALPLALPVLARSVPGLSRRGLLCVVAFLATGCATYVYLPLRALADPLVNLGNPTTLGRFFWVVSAQAFQKNTGSDLPQPMGERFADVAVQLAQAYPLPILLLGAGGGYVLLRHPPTRRLGLLWVGALGLYASARAWLGFVRSNPDALGYLMPAVAAIAILAVAFVGALLVAASTAKHRRSATQRMPLRLAWLLSVACLLLFPLGWAESSMASFAATDAFDDPLRRDLPPRSVVFAHVPQTVFRYWGGEGVERLRPDVTFIPIPFLTYPGMAESLVHRTPELRDVLLDYLSTGALQSSGLESLAALRPVLVELDVRVPMSLFSSLSPTRFYYDVLSQRALAEDLRTGARRQELGMTRIYRLLGDAVRERETASQLLWHHYVDALFFAATGNIIAAEDAVDLGLALGPEAAELRALRDALASRSDDAGPLDITPFMPRMPRAD